MENPKCIMLGLLDMRARDCTRRVYDPKGIAPTLTTSQGGYRQVKIYDYNKHRVRKLTPTEYGRLQGFPMERWNQVVSDSQAYKQFGNAVTVTLFAEIAKQIKSSIENRRKKEMSIEGITVEQATKAAERLSQAIAESCKTDTERECERIRRFEILAGDYFPEDVKNRMIDGGFFGQAASTHYHSAYFGGLADHSHAVTEILVEYTKKLGLAWQKERSPYVVGYLHDICKMDSYIRKQEDGRDVFEFNRNQILSGHGDKSAIIAAMLIPDLTDEEMLCIRWHMGAFENDKDAWNAYGRAIERFPNVLYTHTADMAASRITEK